MANSLRLKDERRKEKRDEVKERKTKEKEKKKEEIKKKKKIKKEEIEAKLEELKKLTGNDQLAFEVRFFILINTVIELNCFLNKYP